MTIEEVKKSKEAEREDAGLVFGVDPWHEVLKFNLGKLIVVDLMTRPFIAASLWSLLGLYASIKIATIPEMVLLAIFGGALFLWFLWSIKSQAKMILEAFAELIKNWKKGG